jgi:hypothetical protein
VVGLRAPLEERSSSHGKLEGPDDGTASSEAIEKLVKWFGDVLDELAPNPAAATGT